MDYTIRNLREIEDKAASGGFGEHQESRFPREELKSETVGLAHHFVRPGMRQAFAHRHRDAEEVFVVLTGHGRVKLGEEIRDIRPLDAIRVAPAVARSFEAGPEGLELLAFGPRHASDGEIVPGDFWSEGES